MEERKDYILNSYHKPMRINKFHITRDRGIIVMFDTDNTINTNNIINTRNTENIHEYICADEEDGRSWLT